MWFCMMVGGLGMYTMDLYKAFGQTFITDDLFLAMIGTVAAIFNSSGRILWGLSVDRFSFKVCITNPSTHIKFFSGSSMVLNANLG